MHKAKTVRRRHARVRKPKREPLAESIVEPGRVRHAGRFMILTLEGEEFRVEKGRRRDTAILVTLQGRTHRIPLDVKGKTGSRNWERMPEAELVEFAIAYCKEYDLTKKKQLDRREPGLYKALRNKNLLDGIFGYKKSKQVKLGKKTFRIPLDGQGRRAWSKMSDERLTTFAKAYCKHHGIKKGEELQDKDPSLHRTLGTRRLVGTVFKRRKQEKVVLGEKIYIIPLNPEGKRNWTGMREERIVRFAQAYCEHHDITRKIELEGKERGLYVNLRGRGLLDKVLG